MSIQLIVIKPDKKKYDITGSVTNITWEGNYKQSARKLSFSRVASTIDKNISNFDIPVGSHVVFYNSGKELFRGMIFSRNLSGNDLSYTAFDDGIRLLKIQGYYNFKGKPVLDICNQICKDYGIPIGTFASVPTKITKVFIGTSLYDIIMSCYTEASKSTGKKYMCIFKDGKVHVIEKGATKLKLTFEEMYNIEGNSFSESVENMVNKVVIVDDKGLRKAHYFKQNEIDAFGLFQEVLRYSDEMNMKTEAENKYAGIEQTASLNGYGDVSCVTGFGVTVKDSNTKMNGLFHIESDKHTWENGDYSINLNLNFKNIMNEVSAGQDESTSTSSGSKGGYSTSTTATGKAGDLINIAKSKLGNRYVWGATGPTSFDCSGFTSWCYKQIGITIPRTSGAQSGYGKAISKSDARPGDLLFFSTNGTGHVSHVGMYIGGGQMIHAANPKKGVRIDNITSGYYVIHFVNARRML